MQAQRLKRCAAGTTRDGCAAGTTRDCCAGGTLEAFVSDNSRALGATLAGAVIGGLAGYFFFTERGRALRRQIEPALEDLGRELNSFRQTVEKAAGVARGGWQV